MQFFKLALCTSILTCSYQGYSRNIEKAADSQGSFQVRLIIKDKATLNKLDVEEFTLKVYSWKLNQEIPLVLDGDILTLPEPGSYSISGTAPGCGTLQGFGNRYFDATTNEAASFVRCS